MSPLLACDPKIPTKMISKSLIINIYNVSLVYEEDIGIFGDIAGDEKWLYSNNMLSNNCPEISIIT